MYAVNDVALKQIDDNDWPSLTNKLPDVSAYDLILVGSPVWSGYPATPVHTFLAQALRGNWLVSILTWAAKVIMKTTLSSGQVKSQ